MSNSGSVELNLEKSLDSIVKAKNNGADLVLFPEVQLTEFFHNTKGRMLVNMQ